MAEYKDTCDPIGIQVTTTKLMERTFCYGGDM